MTIGSWTMRIEHFEQLQKATAHPAGWQSARCPRAWAEKAKVPESVKTELPQGRMTREQLKALCADENISNEACFTAVMAWRAMKYEHGQLSWSQRDIWTTVIKELRTGKINRREAYRQFHRLRSNGHSMGLGPAYFTKLIFFVDPKHDGYIMDQWTSLSINLLSDAAPLVHLVTSSYRGRRTDTVSDRNDAAIYERFCIAVKEIGRRLGCSAEQAEQHLFSQGGRAPAPWRQFVKLNRP